VIPRSTVSSSASSSRCSSSSGRYGVHGGALAPGTVAAQHRGMGSRRPQVRHLVTWFLLGSDLHTAYTFVAVPALLYGTGAIGFFAVP